MSWTWGTCKVAPTLGRRRACPNANRGVSCSARRSRGSTPVDPHHGCSEPLPMFCAFSNTRRRRRRMRTNLYNIAIGAAFVAAIPSGMGFVVPTPAGLVRGRVSSGTGEGLGSGDLAARQRRLRTVEVAMDPRVGKTAPPPPIAVEPVRPPGKEGPHLPWTGSAAGPEFPLSYMPFMEHMLNVLALSFGEMRALPLADKLAYVENPEKQARMLSMSFTSPEVRKVRLTYFDAGSKVQVLNAVIYPDPSLDLPLLGIDLISFGGKHLMGIDFQPLFEDEVCRSRFSKKLAPIKAKYPEFSQKMSARFYDSARFFSDEMLFGRFEDEYLIQEKLFPAYEEYLSLYMNELLTAAAQGGDDSPEARARVLDRHRAYDQYNAERDPAHGLFRNYYGEKFSEEYMDKFLFELSTRPAGGYPKGAPGAEGARGPSRGGAGAAGTAGAGGGRP